MNDFERTTTQAIESVWQRTPHPFQLKVMYYVISMRCKPNKPAATLLIQRARSGKSRTHQQIDVIDAGVVLVIDTTLSLGADQVTKIRNTLSTVGYVSARLLGGAKLIASRSQLIKHITSMTSSSNHTTFLFTSPKALLQPCWYDMTKVMINKKMLKIMYIDEARQFVDFGTSFRK